MAETHNIGKKPRIRAVGKPTAVSRRPLSNPQKVAITVALISVFGAGLTAVFANWDKVFGSKAADEHEIPARVVLNEQRQEGVEDSIDSNITKVESANHTIQQDPTVPADVKKVSAATAAAVVAEARREQKPIRDGYRKINEAIKAKNNTVADLTRAQLIDRLSKLQQYWNGQLNQAPDLRRTTGPLFFKMGEQKKPKQPGEPTG